MSSLAARLYKLARTPAQRRKALEPLYHGLWDALRKQEPALRKLGYRMTASTHGSIRFLFKDTDVHVTLHPDFKRIGPGDRVGVEVFSPTWHRPSVRAPNWVEVQERERALAADCRYKSWPVDPKQAKSIVAFLAELAPELDALNLMLETPEISSER